MINSTFSNINAEDIGGAIYIIECHLDISNSSFTSNMASKSGGSIYFSCMLSKSNK